MKYWRGYLVALVLGACSWGLMRFAESHWLLIDMIYPYTARIIQNFMANWSSGVSNCLWQLAILVFVAGVLASLVMLIVWKWNPIQWFGWIMSVISLVVLLHTGLYGLNDYAGPLADDVRLNVTDYTVSELTSSAKFFQDEAHKLSTQIRRDSSGQPQYPDFATLAEQAGNGFDTLTYEQYNSVFAGSRLPVKELGWSSFFASKGQTYVLSPITGEAAVNPETPAVGLPFAMCQVMAKRLCISNEQDAAFAAFLACINNESVEFQYSGYLMAYRYCCNALSDMNVVSAQTAARSLKSTEDRYLRQDLETYNNSFAVGSDHAYYEEKEPVVNIDLSFLKTNRSSDTTVEVTEAPERSNVADLLVSWHIQNFVLPLLKEEEVTFDPMDETQVDLSGIVNAPTGSESDDSND